MNVKTSSQQSLAPIVGVVQPPPELPAVAEPERRAEASRALLSAIYRRSLAFLLAGAAVALGAAVAPPAYASNDYGPDTCLYGYVWRGATPSDHVCVTGAIRAQTAYDNSQAAARRNPNGGPYGPDTCLFGYVWRGTIPSDHVCVTGATRSQAAYDNSQAAARRDSLNLSYRTYTNPPVCNGNVCSTGDDFARFQLQGDHVNVGPVPVQLRRASDGALLRTWYGWAYPIGAPGGSFSLKTGVINCGGPADSYFIIQDSQSGRWSAPLWVSSICHVL